MFKVIPATLSPDGSKIPLINGWQSKATNDQEQIKQWQQFFRDRLTFFGIVTGPENGLLVLDVDFDEKKGTNGYQTIQERGLIIPDTLCQRSLKGGAHYIFKYPTDGRDYHNKVKFLPGLDTRGRGGWIAYYGFLNPQTPIADAPQWLLEAYTVKLTEQLPSTSNVVMAPEVAMGIFNNALEEIRHAPPGESNNMLNKQSYIVGQLVASGALTKDFAEIELFKAAKERGKPDYEALATITSGLNGGMQNPITCPFPAEPPKLAFEIPPVPGTEEKVRWTPRYYTRADLRNGSYLRKPQLFKDWSTEDITITTADGGTGKTTLKLFEAVCLALGERFLGFDCKGTGKTLFITGEDSEAKLGAMIGKIMESMGLFDGTPENEAKVEKVLSSIVVKKDVDLCLIAKDRQGFLHSNREALDKVLEAVADIRPRLIVFDPIASFWGSESALNDMNKAVAKFMGELQEKSGACVEMINHMGKDSSKTKDMSQFAGRGGTGLPSHARVARVLRGLPDEEYRDLTGEDLASNQSAMLCNIGKFSDGSPLTNKPFIIIREGYLFSRKDISPKNEKDAKATESDNERIFNFIKTNESKRPTRNAVIAYFMEQPNKISQDRTKRSLSLLAFTGFGPYKIKLIDNPDNIESKEKVYIVTDSEGNE